MPVKGKLLSWYRLEFTISATASGDTKVWGAYGRTRFTPDAVSVSDEIRVIFNASQDAGTYAASVAINADSSPISVSSSTGYSATGSVTITVKDLTVYNTVTNSGPTVSWSGIDVVIDGTTHSYGADGATYSAGTGPCYVPLIGIPWEIGIDEASPYSNHHSGDTPGDLVLDIVGGWRFKETSGDSWTALPVTLPPTPVFDGGAFNLADIITCTDTSDGAIHIELELNTSASHSDGVSPPVRLCLLPDLEKAVQKISVDYRALWYREVFPQFDALDIRQMWDPVAPDYSEVGGNTELYEEESVLLLPVGRSTAAIEDVFSQSTYAPIEVHAGQKVNPFIAYEIDSFIFPFDSSTSWTNYLGHNELLPRYLNSWANPHWQMFLWWQDWDLDGSATDPADYWHKVRSQWIWNSGLSSGDKRQTRNSFVIDCLNTESGISPFWDSYTASLGWVGASRWKTRDFTVRTSYTYDSSTSAIWTLTDCTASWGGSITLTSTGASTISAKLELGRYDYAPYQWAHVANKIFVDWSTTNVSAVRVYLVGVDYNDPARPSARALLKVNSGDTTTTKNHTYDRPVGTSEQYAGSWAIDNGVGVVTDTGADFDGDGISAATMADAERALAFQLLAGYSAAYLEFEIDLVSTGSPVTIEYPRLEYSYSDDPQMVIETGQTAAIIWKNGPGIRWGNTFYYDSGVLTTPELKGLGVYPNTIIDALCWGRNWIEGKLSTDGLTTELATIFDTEEGQSAANADARSLACILPKTYADGGIHSLDKTTLHMALIGTQAEWPPMAAMPYRKRDSAWAATGTYAQVAYSWAQERRDFVSAGRTPIHLRESGGAQWTAARTGALSGWTISSHSHAVDNSESGYFIYYNGAKRATDIRPWHGYFFADGSASPSGSYPSVWRGNFGEYLTLHVEGQDLRFEAWRSTPLGSADQSTIVATVSGTLRHPHGMTDRRERIYVRFEVEDPAGTFTAYECHSDDFGATWSTPA